MAAPRVSFSEKDLENGEHGTGAADRYDDDDAALLASCTTSPPLGR
jgi:hypothetical protein